MSHPPRRRATFQPRFTLMLFYFFAFFFLFCLLIIAPGLFEIVRTVPTGPEQQQMAAEAARETVRPFLWIALLLAAVATGLGIRFRMLPGLRVPH